MTEGIPYWRDVGTIDAYWEANIALTHVVPELNLYDEDWPIWTYQEQLPPAKFVFDDDGRRGTAIDSIVASGCIISGSTVRRSLLFSNVRVHDYCTIEDAVLLPSVDVGRNVVLRKAVVEKHCRLPDGLRAGVDAALDRRRFHVTEGGITLIIPEMLGQQGAAAAGSRAATAGNGRAWRDGPGLALARCCGAQSPATSQVLTPIKDQSRFACIPYGIARREIGVLGAYAVLHPPPAHPNRRWNASPTYLEPRRIGRSTRSLPRRRSSRRCA
jgi:hypothetical protein